MKDYVSIVELGNMLDDLWTEQAEWSQATFGTDQERGPIGPLKHLEKEAVEAQACPEDVMEYADCFLLLVDAARRAGIELRILIHAAYCKLQINKQRQWPKATGNDPVEHLRNESEAA